MGRDRGTYVDTPLASTTRPPYPRVIKAPCAPCRHWAALHAALGTGRVPRGATRDEAALHGTALVPIRQKNLRVVVSAMDEVDGWLGLHRWRNGAFAVRCQREVVGQV